MIKNDRQLGAPFGLFSDTKANIEAIAGVEEGATAYATDSNEFGTFNGATWDWGQGGSFDLPSAIHGADEKSTIHDDDELVGVDSEDSWALVKWTFATIKATLKTYFDTLYATIVHTHAASDVTSGTMATARLGSGTADATTVLHGDQTYKTNVSAKQMLFMHGMNQQVPAASTRYLPLVITGDGLSAGFFNIVASMDGTIRDLRITTIAAQPGTGTQVLTLQVENSDTALVITIPAGAAAATFSNTSDTVNVTAGQRIQVKVVNNASSAGANLTAGSCSYLYT